MNGGPVVTVQLLNRETAVQELREQLGVTFTGTAVEGEVVHPLPIPEKQNNHLENVAPEMGHGYVL